MVDSSNQVQIQKYGLPLGELDDDLRATFAQYEIENWQLGQDWFANLSANALSADETAVIYVAHLSPDNYLICPLRLDAKNREGHALSTFYTSLYSPLGNTSSPEILYQALFSYLLRVEKLTAITLSPMDRSTSTFDIAYHALGQAGWVGAHTFFCFGNWVHNLENADYQSYLATRPSKLRNTISRRTRKFLTDHNGQLELLKDADSVEDAIDTFIGVYNKSWKREEPHPNFIPQLLRLAARRGWLRLGIAYSDGVPVASQIWIVANGTTYIYKLAYDEDYKQLSPGTVLTAYMMNYVIDTDKVSTIDYLSGDDNYKKDWMSVRRERHGMAAYNPRTLRGGTMLIGHYLKGWYKKLSGAPG